MVEGNLDGKILFVSDFLRIQDKAQNTILFGDRRELLFNSLMRAGISASEVALTVIHGDTPAGGGSALRFSDEVKALHFETLRETIRASKANVIVPLGSYALEFLTSEKSIDKWHLSIIKTKAEFGGRKVVPLLHPEHVMKVYGDMAYISFGCLRLKEEMQSPKIDIPERIFHINPPFERTMQFLKDKCLRAKELSVDIETGNGIINTVGIAVSPTEAIAIQVLPYAQNAKQYYQLWQMLRAVLESSIPKIAQNHLHETQFLSRYGIYIQNIAHDTMWCMKFLHPEFDKGLHNVGRIYTRYPYWKDDGKDWNNIKNWHEHLEYNCKDTTGTFAAALNQRKALASRGLSELFYGFVMQFAEPIREMCTRGLLLDEYALETLRHKVRSEADNHLRIIDTICKERIGRTINPRSSKQLQVALKEMGINLPTKKNKKTGKYVESADKKSLVKLRRKYKNEEILPSLIGLSAKNKQLSSYLEFEYDRQTKKVRYSLDGCGTETGRWSGHNDPWGNGFNPQTVPKSTRNIFVAEPGKALIEIDLSQAESRFVAWDAPEPKLMKMLQNKEDIHSYVAAQIYQKPIDFVKPAERQLGKKAGHATNYGTGPDTFAEACLVEMDLVLTRSEAKRIIDTYFQTFPGIKQRQLNIQKEIRRCKKLITPIGRERIFYGRIGDDLFREAYAFAPQSTIPDITNCLMLYLQPHCELLLQVHDSLLVQVHEKDIRLIHDMSKDYDSWHPEIKLAGGNLIIPTDFKVGSRWGNLKNY